MGMTQNGRIRLSIDPVTRLEGHLKAEVTVEDGRVTDAQITGGMFRGFESILGGRDPRDAPQIVQRVCGVCPTSHAFAASMALENAAGVTVPPNGRLVRNLIIGANIIQSHLLHFYQLSGQDFFQGPLTAPFTPRYAHPDLRLPEALAEEALAQYLEALKMRAVCHQMAALLGGRMPHAMGIVTGGATTIPGREALKAYTARLREVRHFLKTRTLPLAYSIAAVYRDLCDLGQGRRNALCVGAFPESDGSSLYASGVYLDGRFAVFEPDQIREEARYAWLSSNPVALPFDWQGETRVEVDKPGAYSFVKAPLYAGQPMETGPAARLWINNLPLSPVGRGRLREVFGRDAATFREMGEDLAFSLMGRHLARMEEAFFLSGQVERWLGEVRAKDSTYTPYTIPRACEGIAMTEAPRGALIHAVRVREGVIGGYQILPATLWNTGPRSNAGQRGTLEEALIGVPVPDSGSPVNVARLVRAFDP